MKHIRITISGKVQGVFFRKYTVLKAKELGINGLVKNLLDGSVYIEAESDEEPLATLLAWCYEGSPTSYVEQVNFEEGEMKGFDSFIISR